MARSRVVKFCAQVIYIVLRRQTTLKLAWSGSRDPFLKSEGPLHILGTSEAMHVEFGAHA